jgi:tetratricopeptide (TPR) repeat protein
MSSPTWNSRPRRLAAALVLLGLLEACSSPAPKPSPVTPAAKVAPPAVAPAAAATASGSTAMAANAASSAPHPDVPPAARADFDRAVRYMRAGNTSEAELGFKQVSLQYPQFAAPLVDLGLLQRKQGQLAESEESLKSAVGHESSNALAWTELGVTQRMRGKFKDAAASYEQAIVADPRYAPAWRNLGVVSDLYLDDPQRALKAFEQYKAITGEDKPVNGWIAELRQRLGIKPPEAKPAATPADGAPATAPPEPQPAPGSAPANAAATPSTPKAGG